MSSRSTDYWAPLDANPENPDWREDHEAVTSAFAGMQGKGWLRANCPRCEDKTGKPDKRASLGYNTATGGYHCQKCGLKGKLTEQEREELPNTEAEPEEEALPGKPTDPEPCWGYQPLYEGPSAELSAFDLARTYYEGRGLSSEVGRETGVGSSTWGMNQHRILIPFPDYQNPERLKGWVSRYYLGKRTPDGSSVYRYARRFDRATYLYNEPALYEDGAPPVYVVEGALDAHALWPDAVAVLGKPLPFHVECFQRALRPVVIVLDGDAHEEGWALAMKLKFLGVRAASVRLPPGKDPDEVDRDWLDYEAALSLA